MAWLINALLSVLMNCGKKAKKNKTHLGIEHVHQEDLVHIIYRIEKWAEHRH